LVCVVAAEQFITTVLKIQILETYLSSKMWNDESLKVEIAICFVGSCRPIFLVVYWSMLVLALLFFLIAFSVQHTLGILHSIWLLSLIFTVRYASFLQKIFVVKFYRNKFDMKDAKKNLKQYIG
jgi:hypothetical protein